MSISKFAGYWRANDRIGLYLGQPQSNPTAPSQPTQSNPTAPSQPTQSNPTALSQTSSPIVVVSHKLWQDDRLVTHPFNIQIASNKYHVVTLYYIISYTLVFIHSINRLRPHCLHPSQPLSLFLMQVSEHFSRDLPAMYTRVHLSSSSLIEANDGPVTSGRAQSTGPVKSVRAQSNSPVKSDRAQSTRSSSCALNTDNFQWIWTKHPTITTSQTSQSNPTAPSQTSQSNPTAPSPPSLSNLTGGEVPIWFDEAAAEALLLRVMGVRYQPNERSTLVFYGDSQMRVFREAMIGWICNMDDPQKVRHMSLLIDIHSCLIVISSYPLNNLSTYFNTQISTYKQTHITIVLFFKSS